MTSKTPQWTSEDDRPLPEPPFVRKVAEDFWENSLTLVVWALVIWVLSAPGTLVGAFSAPLNVLVFVLMVAPAIAGLMAASGQAAKGGFARLGDAARGALRLYRRSVALGLPLALILILILVTSDTLNRFPERQEMTLALAAQTGLGLALALLHIYLYPILALYDTSVRQTAKLALAMVGKFIWQTLALMALGVGLLFLTTLHQLIGPVVPAIWSVIVMNAVWRMTRNLPINKP